MTVEEKTRKIERVIDEEVRPLLRRDGEDVELLDVQGNKVMVRLSCANPACITSAVPLRGLVEQKLQELVDPLLEVVDDELAGMGAGRFDLGTL